MHYEYQIILKRRLPILEIQGNTVGPILGETPVI